MSTFLYRDPWERENHEIEADVVVFGPAHVIFYSGQEFMQKILVLAIQNSRVQWVVEQDDAPVPS